MSENPSDEPGADPDGDQEQRESSSDPAEGPAMQAWSSVVSGDAEDAGGASDPALEGRARARSTVPADELFGVLSSPANRYVLTYLLGVESPAEYGDLVEYVVERVDAPGDMTPGKFRGHVAAAIINETLPELHDAGLVEVDEKRQVVSPTPAIDAAAPHLALALSALVNPPPSPGD